MDIHLVEHHVPGVTLVLQHVEAAYARLLQRGCRVALGLHEERLQVLGPDPHVHVDDEHQTSRRRVTRRDPRPGLLHVDRVALVVRNHTANKDLADDVGTFDVDDAQPDPAVVNEQRVAGLRVASQPLARGRHPLLGAGHLVDGDPHGVAWVPLDRPGGEPAQPDLRALPWLKFNRAMSIPAATSSSIRSGLAVAGPSVHTIFARRGEAMADVELVMTLPVRAESVERVSDGPLVEVDATADACRCDRLEEPTS